MRIKTLIILVSLILLPVQTFAYSYSGIHWSTSSASVDSGDSSIPASWITPIARSMSAWNAPASPFYFYVGSNGHKLYAQNSGNNGTPAITYYSYSGNSLIDVDTYFNTYYPWSTSGDSGYYDVQNVLTHELGHWLVLNDLYSSQDAEKTMYGYTSLGETKKRSLDTDDINGINAIYY
ncbi:hypothetical protein CVU83_02320 [Candidatus Falkowbacteria bacterium HGW-Falkowbacteria-2]|uniref:Peptidase M10 metallopeptidase domain-containing protein n=1 Tax=Candidatus Falkowbacteria bacterium HGW-Falkowbacteria-2 TaxID=2013769 RepID=A0A2N2DZV4_9BACT|nr:MAG: hypothetical protein CVU83_02320 [Candidatus Falkowbacteria bacterium HGW-Falkowbacteria-2]